MDADGYPDEQELEKVRTWPYTDLPGWFAYIKSLWWAADWGWTDPWPNDGKRRRKTPDSLHYHYHISTGGHSINESIIGAMRENFGCWSLTWYSHRRGGHYEFEMPTLTS